MTERLDFIRELVRNNGLYQVMSMREALQTGVVEFEGDNYIQEGVIIGLDGFGYEINEKGEYEKFPHYGKVIVEQQVDIYSGTTVQRGSTKDTVIQRGAKIAGNCNIGHNTNIGRHCLIGAHNILCGSVILGHHVKTGEFVRIGHGIKIGNNVTIRSYCNITKDIPDDSKIKVSTS